MAGLYWVTIYNERGETQEVRFFNDPCEALAFLDERVGSMPEGRRGVRDLTAEGIDTLRALCAAGGGGGGTDPVLPATLPPVEDPSSTGADAPPPADTGETPQSIGAPDPEVPITVESEPANPGESDGRPLPRQYYDPRRPMPDYEVAQQLSNRGVPPEELGEEVRRVVRNEPLPGMPHWDFSQNRRDDLAAVADPVIIFTGQYSLTATDLSIPSRGFPLRFTRHYRSGPVFWGPLGYNWDHEYNVFLRPLNDGGAAVWTGALREEVYRPVPGGGFEPPTGVFRKLEWEPPTPLTPERYVLTDREGMRQIFERPTGWPHPDRLPLTRLEDRHGNAHHLTYDAEGRLIRVEDFAGRFLELSYGDGGRIRQVRDHTGRAWQYAYDPEEEHLIAVTSPATPDNPEGLTTRYEYDRYQSHPALIHNLTRVLDPAGRVVVENRYGTDPGTDDFGRVVYQEFGGFEATFHATRLQYVPPVPDAINVPALRVEVVDPGVYFVYTFNYRGDLLDERFRLARDGSYRLVARRYRYDHQGNLIEMRQPNGLGIRAEYDSENPDPRARGNLLRVSLLAPPTRPAPAREIARYTYEPRYHRLKTAIDEAGAVTTFIYDYEETTAGRGDVIRIEHPAATLPDGSLQTSHEVFTYNTHGQLVERVSGEGHRFLYEYEATGPAAGYLSRIIAGAGPDQQVHSFTYDPAGNLASVRAGSGPPEEYEHDALGRLIRLQRPEVNGQRGEIRYRYGRDGRLAFQETPRGSYSDPAISDPFIRHAFTYDALGRLISAVYGVNTSQPRRWTVERTGEGFPSRVVDPLGRVTVLEYDDRNLLLRQTLFAGSPDERSFRYIYDRNGNLVRITDPAGREAEYVYDAWDRLVEIRLPGAPADRTRIRYTYGPRDQVKAMETVGLPEPGRPPAVLAAASYTFDQRGRLVRRREGPFQTDFWYDRDSCLVRLVQPRGATRTTTYDALGRSRVVVDALGNQIRHTFDDRGNLTLVEEVEQRPDGGAPEVYRSVLQYDARGRLIRLVDPLGNAVTAEYDDRDLLIAVTGPLGDRTEYAYDLEDGLILARSLPGGASPPVEHRWRRDAAGRVIAYVDPEGSETTYAYDPLNRWSRRSLPDGTTYRRVFSPAGDLVEELLPSGTRLEHAYGPDGLLSRTRFTPGPGLLPLPELRYERDGLGRAVRLSQGAYTLERRYDQAGRLVSESAGGATARWSFDDGAGTADLHYPDGRVDRYHLDLLGRIERITLLTPAPRPLTGPGLAPGAVLAEYTYVGPQRLHRRRLANGTETRYTYDGGRRVAGIEHLRPDGSLLARVQYVYDAAGRRRVRRSEPAPGASWRLTHDAHARLVQVAEGVPAPPVPPAMSQADADAYLAALSSAPATRTWSYDLNRADGRRAQTLTDSSGSTTDTYLLDGLHRPIRLERTGPSGHLSAVFAHDADGRRTGDHRFAYRYDAAGRLREVRDAATSALLLTLEHDPLGRVVLRTVAGGSTERLRHLGYRALQDDNLSGDAVRQRLFGTHIDELILESDGSQWWAHQDALLTLLAVSGPAGEPLERYTYDPFGLPFVWAPDGVTPRASSAVGQAPRFAGHPALSPAGLYDARARVYDAVTGTYLQPDPRGFADSPNLYAYVGHNPADLSDPTGEIPPLVAAVVIIGALAGAGYSFYDAYHHPERYEGWGALRAFGNTVGGALIGGVAALAGEAVLAAAGTGSLVTGAGGSAALGTGAAGGGSLTLGQAFVLSGTVSATSGLVWRVGFNGLFPEYVDAPSASSLAADYLTGGALGVAGPLAFRAVGLGGALLPSGIREGVTRALQGPWRAFGNVGEMLRNPRVRYTWRNLFWDPRSFRAVSQQYWRRSGGAQGMALHHWLIQNQSRWVPQGLRNAGFNLLEIPASLNTWMGGRLAREWGFRFTVGSLLGAVGYGSYRGTEFVLESVFDGSSSASETRGIGRSDGGGPTGPFLGGSEEALPAGRSPDPFDVTSWPPPGGGDTK